MKKITLSPLKNEVDFLNVLFCILVVFIHLCATPLKQLNIEGTPYLLLFILWRLSAFVVQGFIFLSGIKLAKKYRDYEKIPYKEFMIARVKRIYLPYLLWTAIYYLVFILTGWIRFDFSEMMGYFLDGSITAPFYFIIVIMQFYLLFPLFLKLAKGKHVLLINLGILVFNIAWQKVMPLVFPEFPYFDRLFPTYLIFFLMGCSAGIHFEKFKEKMHNLFAPLVVFAALFGAMDCSFFYAHTIGFYTSAYLESIHLIYCVLMILALFALSHYLLPVIQNWRLLSALNKASYHIYLSHCLVIFLVEWVLIWQRWQIRTSVYFVVLALLTYGIPLVGSFIYHRLKEKRISD